MPYRNPPNRSKEYRHRAEEARAKAETSQDADASKVLLQDAETWERMAQWEDENNPPRRPLG